MFNTVLFRALTALGLLAFSYSHAMTLHQIHIITRHGSRYVLTKNHTSLGEGTSAFLTSTGIQQMHDLGIQLRDKYSDHFDFLPNYDPQLVYFESSDFDRTIVSASALASGLFHVENSTVPVHVPVHTFQLENDLYIRAYDKCSQFTKDLNALYKSPEWIQIQEENDGLLRKLATIRSFQKYADANGRVSLAQVWNVYDAIYVAKSECESNAQDARVVCESLEDPFVKDVVSDTEFEQLRRLVGKSEFLRYRTHSAARFVAYNLLARITSRIVFEDAKFSREDGSAKIYLYSGHYPLLLALFAALDHTYSDDGIPNYSTAIVIEVYEDENKEKRVVYNYHGGQGLEDATIQSPVRFLGRHCDAESCPFENLLQLVEDWSEKTWCDTCGGNSQVDVCLQYEEVECEARTGLATFGGAVLGLVVGIIGMFFWGRVSHEKKASTASRSTEQPLEYSPKELSSAQQDDEHNLTTISTEEAKFEHHDDKSEGGASFL
ncbi:lysosomal acid phosphatase [Fistulifera solaris]|uniref:Lysosomal acid phosphatase n=1 Tax=Fistulifera solaris TaxID=1519565 RepID=A0A1Z5JFT3_FISSO|nr:lysosomal acid phosphatase [Fistulifera solaris]|eukprot:GAX12877.1 lysosomal acid phosphatase [Fistulifera solaris]